MTASLRRKHNILWNFLKKRNVKSHFSIFDELLPDTEIAYQFLLMASGNEPVGIMLEYFRTENKKNAYLHVCELYSCLKSFKIKAKSQLLWFSKVVTKPLNQQEMKMTENHPIYSINTNWGALWRTLRMSQTPKFHEWSMFILTSGICKMIGI